MTPKPLPPVELIRKLLDYDPETGNLTWRARDAELMADIGCKTTARAVAVWNGRNSGKTAGVAMRTGYLLIGIAKRRFLAHRIAYAIHHGVDIEGHIDHINGNPADNRIENLRVTTHQGNHRNQRMRSTNTSGFMGVRRHKGRWVAEIVVNGRKVYLGRHADVEDAVAARRAAEKRYGFHPNHGRR